MDALLQAVAHAEQDHPGKQDAGEFQRAGPAAVEAVAGDDLREGDEGDRRQDDGENVLLKAGDPVGPAPLGEEQKSTISARMVRNGKYALMKLLPKRPMAAMLSSRRWRLLYRTAKGKDRRRSVHSCVGPNKGPAGVCGTTGRRWAPGQVGDQLAGFDASAASITSWPTSSRKRSQTGFMVVDPCSRCSAESSRMVRAGCRGCSDGSSPRCRRRRRWRPWSSR